MGLYAGNDSISILTIVQKVFDERNQLAYLIKNKVHVFGRASRKVSIFTTLPERRNWVGRGNYFNVKTASVGMKVRGNHLLIGWRAYTMLMLEVG